MKISKFMSYILAISLVLTSHAAMKIFASDKNALSKDSLVENKADFNRVSVSNDGGDIVVTAVSPPITDANVISLNKTSDNVLESSTFSLTATVESSSLTVNWFSSNTNAVTIVASQGNTCTFVANKAGISEITASVMKSGNARYVAKCTIYVYIENGVYYIKNLNSNHYLNVQDGKALQSTNVQQYSKYSSSTVETTKLRQMWKVYHLGECRYSIRPMSILSKGLDVTGNNADIYHIGLTDTLAGVPSYAEWMIEWSSNGYVLKKDGSDSYALQTENSSTAVGANVVANTYDSTQSAHKWTFEKITNAPTGVILYDLTTRELVTNPTKYIAPQETRTLSQMGLFVAVYSPTDISQSVEWLLSSSISAEKGTSSGEFVGLTAGSTVATARAHNKIASFTLTTTEIPNGIYLLENRQVGYFADIKGPTMANGTTIHQWKLHGGKSQKWLFTHLGDGYYSIKTTYSTSNYYLGVKSDSTSQNADIVLRSGTLTNGMKWKVETTANGAVKLIPKTGESKGYVLATSTSNATNGAKLLQGAYVSNTSYRDEWYLNQIKDYSLIYLGLYDGDLESPSEVTNDTSMLPGEGYSTTVIDTKEEGMLRLMLGQLSIINTHGMQTYISLKHQGVGGSLLDLTIDDVETYDVEALSNVKLLLLLACNTGKGGASENNFVNAVYGRGAQCVVGFMDVIYDDALDVWRETLISALVNGSTVSEALILADNELDKPEYSSFLNRVKNAVKAANRYVVGSDSVIPCA